MISRWMHDSRIRGISQPIRDGMLVGAAIRSVAAALAGDQEAANRVELQLPET